MAGDKPIEPENEKESRTGRVRQGSGLGGVILILIGLVFIGVNFGWWGADVWWALGRLWPLLLVLIGLRLLLPRARVYSWVLLAVIVALVAGLTAAPQSWRQNWPMMGGGTQIMTNQTFTDNYDAGQVKRYEVNLEYGAAAVDIKPLPDSKAGTVLYEAEFTNSGRIEKRLEVSGETAKLELNREGSAFMMWPPQNRQVTLYLNPKLPLKLTLDVGASKLTADLSAMRAENLYIKAGAASGELKLGSLSDTVQATVDAGASSLTLRTPANMPTKITLDGGLSSQNFEAAGLMKDGDVYHSFEYGNATRHIEIDLKAGASSITLDRYGPGEFKG